MKHAGCRHIAVIISSSEGLLGIQISDDGIGYVGGGRKSGLQNLEERAKECNGTFSITKKEPLGTRALWVARY
jgi:signal transduction histidine kinase